jgi:HNH endonuclease
VNWKVRESFATSSKPPTFRQLTETPPAFQGSRGFCFPPLPNMPTASAAFADRRRGSRHERGYGAAWTRVRVQALSRDAGLCQPCANAGRVTIGREVDHKVPKYNGGTDDLDNLQTICKPCHEAKTAREALAARGLAGVAPRAHCGADGLPTDPLHPWNLSSVGGVQNSQTIGRGTDLESCFIKPRNGHGGLS